MTGTATYMYAITRAAAGHDLAGLCGIADAPVRSLEAADLACIVSSVDLAEFDEDALRANLEDLDWLERIARQHDAVVQHVSGRSTTLPLRLATICHDDASALSRLDALGDDARKTLAALDGREEWGVKIFAVADEPAPAAAGSTSGTAYLQQRREQVAARTRSAEEAARDADAIYDRLSELAADARRHRPQDPQLTGVAAPMVLNAAFLVERREVGGFRAEVAELAAGRPTGSVVLTGPWPCYSFVSLGQA